VGEETVPRRRFGIDVGANPLLHFDHRGSPSAGVAENQRFTWFDQQGNVSKTIGPRNDFTAFNLSPDERYLAL
jgi:hypothetical protein